MWYFALCSWRSVCCMCSFGLKWQRAPRRLSLQRSSNIAAATHHLWWSSPLKWPTSRVCPHGVKVIHLQLCCLLPGGKSKTPVKKKGEEVDKAQTTRQHRTDLAYCKQEVTGYSSSLSPPSVVRGPGEKRRKQLQPASQVRENVLFVNLDGAEEVWDKECSDFSSSVRWSAISMVKFTICLSSSGPVRLTDGLISEWLESLRKS